MVSRFAPPPDRHPPFVPVEEHPDQDADWLESNHLATVLLQALKDAYAATPWDHAIILRVRRSDVPDATRAVLLWCGTLQQMRVYVTGQKTLPAGLLVQRGPGAKWRNGVPPWGHAPEPSTADAG